MRNTHTILFAGAGTLIVAAALVACAGGGSPAAPGVLAGDPSPALQRGHQVYITDCASCHLARDPRTYSRARWDAALPKMEAKAKLSPEDTKALEAYITAALDTPSSDAAK